jgi:hypothetical protein
MGYPKWGWIPSNNDQIRLQADLTRTFAFWKERFETLLGGVPPSLGKPVAEAETLIERWIVRDPKTGNKVVPRTTAEAKAIAAQNVEVLRKALRVLGSQGSTGVISVPDTSALMRNPDLALYGLALGTNDYEVRLPPTVLTELDQLKDMGIPGVLTWSPDGSTLLAVCHGSSRHPPDQVVLVRP